MKLQELNSKPRFVDGFNFVVSLDEVFDTKTDVTWKLEDTKHVGYFSINDENFKINLEPGTFRSYDFINISFQIYKNDSWSTDATLDNKSASKVIGVVINGLSSEIIKFEYDAIVFFAIDNNERRMNIYNWIADRYTKSLGNIQRNVKMKDGQYCTIVFNKEIGEDLIAFKEYLFSQGKI